MRTILCCLVFLLFSVSSNASEIEEICIGISRLAGTIMGNRQNSVPLADMLRVVPDDGQLMNNTARGLMRLSYSHPLYGTAAMKQEVISEFKNQTLLDCLEENRGTEK